ncbi:MAG: hypothetical protein AMS24_03755 [Chlamydiae bacterium SM23_39]|nr:MAG: hypothetical protein AMS24_03755 [Chlamydiae bacterium SM23_39]
MESYLSNSYSNLISPDGYIEKIEKIDNKSLKALVIIKNIPEDFLGFHQKKNIIFNIKSTLAQLGINSKNVTLDLSYKKKRCEIDLTLYAFGSLAQKLLPLLSKNTFIGKLFVVDQSRKVREPYYLMRMFGRCDRNGSPLLSFGRTDKRDDLILKKIDGYTIAFLPLKKGVIKYSKNIYGFLPSLSRMLKSNNFQTRELLKLHQKLDTNETRSVKKDEILLVSTEPLHIRTVFAKVENSFLPKGFEHTSACILQPDTKDSGNIYEFLGDSKEEIINIPLEFYTLEPHKEHVFFEDRDQLQISLENPDILFEKYKTAPEKKFLSSVFIVKGKQLEKLEKKDWIKREGYKHKFPGFSYPSRQILLVEKYIKEQSSYPFLKAMEQDKITSQGILLNRYFPSPLMKKMFLNTQIQRCIKSIYFHKPSRSNDIFFSHEDRSFLLDLDKFAISVFWVDESSKNILKYVVRPDKDVGMFVPLKKIDTFRKACFFGIYGSNILKNSFEKELKLLMQKLLELKKNVEHPFFNKNIPIALVTGGGPGVMEIGNKIAKELNILSCANIVNFKNKKNSVLNEQKINPFIDAKMTYRLDRLVERQAEFHLDFPICLPGGSGTDFEYILEELRRKVGAVKSTPILLLGEVNYWKEKISSRFNCNLKTGTIKGSEWISNCFYCIQNAEQGIKIYKDFFSKTLPIGKNGPIYKDGFYFQNP